MKKNHRGGRPKEEGKGEENEGENHGDREIYLFKTSCTSEAEAERIKKGMWMWSAAPKSGALLH